MRFGDSVVRQFRRPEGLLGLLAGWIMASRPSNRRRNLWTVELLDISTGDRVLEFGCGPGRALAACAERAKSGVVVVIDHSRTMLAQAARRNGDALALGRVQLEYGGPELLPTLNGPFDKVFSVNVVQFLPDQAAVFRALHDAMVPGGIVATTYQPRHQNATRGDALRVADGVTKHTAAAGFVEVSVAELALQPVPAICVLGRKPPAPSSRT
jgi:SAM-dependent methyltransferase